MTTEVSEPESKIPALSREEQKRVAGSETECDSGAAESRMFETGKSSGEIKKKAEEAEAKRTEQFRDHFEKIIVFGVYSAGAFFALVCLCWTLNIILPDSLRWLTDAEISKLQGFVTGGVIASTALGQIKKRIG